MREALNLRKRLLGEPRDVATSHNDLALLYFAQGRYEEAKSLLLEALNLRRTLLENKHPDVATTCNNLALFHQAHVITHDSTLELPERLDSDFSKTINNIDNAQYVLLHQCNRR